MLFFIVVTRNQPQSVLYLFLIMITLGFSLPILVVEVSFTYFQELIITQSTVSLKTRFLNRTISIKNFSKWVVKVITQEDSTQTPVYQWVTMEMEEKSIRLVRYEKKFDNFVESYLQTLLEYGLILSEETKQNFELM